jgi:hypothetical protein
MTYRTLKAIRLVPLVGAFLATSAFAEVRVEEGTVLKKGELASAKTTLEHSCGSLKEAALGLGPKDIAYLRKYWHEPLDPRGMHLTVKVREGGKNKGVWHYYANGEATKDVEHACNGDKRN